MNPYALISIPLPKANGRPAHLSLIDRQDGLWIELDNGEEGVEARTDIDSLRELKRLLMLKEDDLAKVGIVTGEGEEVAEVPSDLLPKVVGSGDSA